MIERIIQQQQPICATLLQMKKTDLMPTDAEIIIMEIFLEVMKTLVLITEVMGGENGYQYQVYDHCYINFQSTLKKCHLISHLRNH